MKPSVGLKQHQPDASTVPRCNAPLMLLHKPGPEVALASFPGSGNTWLRYLLQQATGNGHLFFFSSTQDRLQPLQINRKNSGKNWKIKKNMPPKNASCVTKMGTFFTQNVLLEMLRTSDDMASVHMPGPEEQLLAVLIHSLLFPTHERHHDWQHLQFKKIANERLPWGTHQQWLCDCHQDASLQCNRDCKI